MTHGGGAPPHIASRSQSSIVVTSSARVVEPIVAPVGPQVRKPFARRVTGFVALFLLGLAVSATTVLGGRSQVEASPPQYEADFVAEINELRTEHGLNTLIVDNELIAASRFWANEMAVDGDISHAPSITTGITQPWLKVGENVGMGGAVVPLMDAFIASPTHYDNLIDPAYTHVGVGVVWSNGTIFTTHRFMSLPQTPPGTAGTTTPPPPSNHKPESRAVAPRAEQIPRSRAAEQ